MPSSQPTLLTITVSGSTRLANPGDTTQLTAVARYADGTTHHITAEAQWEPGSRSVITVGRGLVTAVGYGTTKVRTYSSVASTVREDIVVETQAQTREVSMKAVLKIAALFAVVLLVVDAAAGQVTRSTITATTEFNPQAGIGGVIPSPEEVVFCPGHEPTQDPFQPCPPGSKIMIRHRQIWFPMQSGDARAVGPITLDLNANYNPDLTGEEWGTFTHTLTAGGSFEGVVTSIRTFENGQWKGTIRGVGHGTGGNVDGTILKFTLIDTYTSPFSFTGQFEGVLTQVPRTQR